MTRSAAYRIAMVFSLVYLTATAALGVAVYWTAHRSLRVQLDERVATEASALAGEFRGSNVAAISDLISHREDSPGPHSLGYALFERDGRKVAGRLSVERPSPGWHVMSVQDATEGPDPSRLLATALPGGRTLVVAAELDEVEATDHLIWSLLAVAFAVIIAISLVGALLLGAYLRRRLSAMSKAAEAIIGGDLEQRIPVGPRGDEFDRLSGALNAMLDRIGELLENLRQVSSDIAHDLRTPLSRLRHQLEAGLGAETSVSVIERAIEQADEVLALFSAILRLSEIEAGRLAASFTSVDLHEIVSDLADSYAPAIEDRGRLLRCSLKAAPPVHGDRELISQAVVNLIENAQVHTPRGTDIQLQLASKNNSVVVTVADNGPGVDPANHSLILRRFARLDTSRSQPGHGLGLSMVAAIAHIHGAALRVTDNAPGLSVSLEFACT